MMQLLINILITYSNIVLISLGFSLIYSVTHFIHFAHGAMFMLSAYFTFFFMVEFGLNFVAAIPMAIVLIAMLGCLIDVSVYRPLRRKNSSSIILLLASLGIYIVLQNVISLLEMLIFF